MITFVLIDAAGVEVTGIGNAFSVNISKAGAGFAPSAGVKAEIGLGWYSYTTTAAETDTVGPISFTISDPATSQQNLEYTVVDRSVNGIEYTYTVTNSVTTLPIEGVTVWITIDLAGTYVVWSGITDVFGEALDSNGAKPRLDPGTYYFFREKSGYIFVNPDQEQVSA